MDIEIKTWLYNILNAIIEIASFFLDQPKEFSAYKNDTKTRRAVQRNVEIIGEATNRILQIDENIKFSNSPKIVDTRNRIIHGYDTVSDETIWGIVIQYLPILKTEIDQSLKDQRERPTTLLKNWGTDVVHTSSATVMNICPGGWNNDENLNYVTQYLNRQHLLLGGQIQIPQPANAYPVQARPHINYQVKKLFLN